MAKGQSPTEAARTAGYSIERASTTGGILKKEPEIIARVSELSERIDTQFVAKMAVTKDAVLQRIADLIDKAEAANKFGDAIRGCQLLGESMQIWSPTSDNLEWDGDVAKLSDSQLAQFRSSIRRILPPEVAEAMDRQHLLESGQVIDITPEPAAQEEQGDGW
jgi:hypothetical protein